MDNAQWLLIIALVIGLAGTVLPMLPGLGMMVLALLVYSYYDSWQTFPIWYIVVMAFIALLGIGIDHLAAALGTKRFGVSSRGFWGAVVGGLLGGLIFHLPGLLIGAIIGTVAMELYQKRTLKQFFSAATGVLVGTAVGMAVQFGLGLLILAVSIGKMLF